MDLTGTKRKSNANVQSADVSKERNNGLSRQVTVKTLPRVNDTDDLIESINRHLFGTQLKYFIKKNFLVFYDFATANTLFSINSVFEN